MDLTENTQPAIFLVSYSIFKLIKEEFKIDLNKASFFAGHSLGEYSALTSAGSLSFSDTLRILKRDGILDPKTCQPLGGSPNRNKIWVKIIGIVTTANVTTIL